MARKPPSLIIRLVIVKSMKAFQQLNPKLKKKKKKKNQQKAESFGLFLRFRGEI
jgi:hypothetical protein